jgi:hypothetical protein
MKTATKFLKYRNLFKAPTAPDITYTKRWIKALTTLHNKLGLDFIDRDEIIEESIISVDLKLTHNTEVNTRYFPLISQMCNYFECVAICTVTVDRESPGTLVKTIKIVGYTQDVLILHNILYCAINGLDHMRYNLQTKYRSSRIRQRRKGTTRFVKHVPAKVRASQNYYIAIDTLASASFSLLAIKSFGTLHNIKMKIIHDKVEDTFRLNYRYPNSHNHKLKHAYTKHKFIKNRIIQL